MNVAALPTHSARHFIGQLVVFLGRTRTGLDASMVDAHHRLMLSRCVERLDRLCLDNIARFKRPKEYLFVPELPRNNTGKVLKTELRARLARP